LWGDKRGSKVEMI